MRRHVHGVWLFALLTAASGCWDWSFPETLLNEADAGNADATAGVGGAVPDGATTGGMPMGGNLTGGAGMGGMGQGGMAGTPMGGMAGTPMGGTPAVGGHAGNACGGCAQPDRPVCEAASGQCRACRTHAECPGGLCAMDGSCPAATTVAFVDTACGAVRNGQAATPYCGLTDALGSGRAYLRLRPGSYPAAEIKTPVQVYGDPAARITAAGCGAFKITGGVTVALLNVQVLAGLIVDGTGTRLTAVGNTFGPGACTGLEILGGSSISGTRNFVVGNAGGGIRVVAAAATLNNNIVAANGSAASAFGGVWLEPAGQFAFVNNTVAGNTAKSGEPGGIFCKTSANVANSILWNNTFVRLAGNQLWQHQGCQVSHSIEEVDGNAAPAATNLGDDPLFVGGDPQSAAAYHIRNGSPARDKANAAPAPAVDFDGQARADDKPDIGADEL